MNSLYDDLKSGGYLDPQYGMVSIYDHQGKNGPNCDNYWLFTAIARQLCEMTLWYDAVWFLDRCQIEYGLLHRFPGRTDDISQQELVGCAAMCPPFATGIHSYGITHWFCWNAENPGVFKWNYFYARFLDFIPFITMSANGFISPVGQLLWSAGVVTTTLMAYTNTSEKIYKWLQVEKVKGKHWITDGAIWIWKKLMQRKYPGGPKELFTIYFPPKHPCIKYAPTDF